MVGEIFGVRLEISVMYWITSGGLKGLSNDKADNDFIFDNSDV